MNYHLLATTKKYSKNPHPILYHLAGCALGTRSIGHYFIIYAYAKWIDDHIDTPSINQSEARVFLERQISIINGDTLPSNKPEEFGHDLFVFFYKNNKVELKNKLIEFIKLFNFDLERKNKIISQEALDQHIERLGVLSFELCELLFAKPNTLSNRFKSSAGRVYILTDMLIDLEEDKKIGYFNIPLEFISNGDTVGYIKHSLLKLENDYRFCIQEVKNIKSMFLKLFIKKMAQKRLKKIEIIKSQWGID